MSDQSVAVFNEDSPRVRRLSIDRPWTWLAAGWADLMAAWPVSLAYGSLMVLGSWLIVLLAIRAQLLWAVLPITGGFFLVAPLLAVGLYETSRRLGAGLPVTLGGALLAWRKNAIQIGMMGALLGLAHLFWVRVAMLLFALFFGYALTPAIENVIDVMLRSSLLLPFLIIGTLIGFGFAAVVFTISAIAIPMLLDRDTNLFTAVATSITAVLVNWQAMVLWAMLIVGFTAMALVPFFLGLAVVMPLVGHATWHAYKDMVE